MNDLFLSYSWDDKPNAFRLEADLGHEGVAVWVDHAELRGGQVLVDKLQDAIQGSRGLGLLWSQNAAASRWVKTEWQAAFLLEKSVIPCLLDDTELPLFLRLVLSCDFRQSYEQGVRDLVLAVREQSDSAPAAPRTSRFATPAAHRVKLLWEGQNKVLDALGLADLAEAVRLQGGLDPPTAQALSAEPEDDAILALPAYHKKNAYMLRHWDDVQAGRYPYDPLLDEAESLFHRSLDVRPDNPSALNGLGSVFLLRGDLNAAEFFVRQALQRAKAEGAAYYEAAEQDLGLIQRLRRRERAG